MTNQKQYAYFSAAIRDGAKLRPQTTGQYFKDDSSCAIGAGLEAIGVPFRRCNDNLLENGLGELFESMQALLIETYPYMEGHSTQCPAQAAQQECGYDAGVKNETQQIVWHLNDTHQWTREVIADWLYLEEEKLGFVTLLETEALKPEVALCPQPVKATA